MSSDVVRSLLITSMLVALAPARGLAQDARVDPDAPAAESPAPQRGPSSTVWTPSLLLDYGGGASGELGLGARLRLDHYPSRYALRVGGFVDAEVQTDGTIRLAGGVANGMWIFGCELGIAYRTDTGRYASSLGLHVGKSILLGPVTIGGRVTIPLVDFLPAQGDGRRVMGLEGQVVITVGLPTTLDGPERGPLDCGHRRR